MPATAGLLEVIVTGVAEARAAVAAGADRLELVAAIERGGLTPGLAVVREVTACVAVPVNVMLRPHDRDFVYLEQERDDLVPAARALREAGASAVVFGALDRYGDVDAALVGEVARSGGLPLTFHRAFDAARDPLAAYAVLQAMPAVTHVLTAGAAATVEHGKDLLRTLTRLQTPPIVLAGGGITGSNVVAIVRYTGVREIHVGSAARTAGEIDPTKIRALALVLHAARLN